MGDTPKKGDAPKNDADKASFSRDPSSQRPDVTKPGAGDSKPPIATQTSEKQGGLSGKDAPSQKGGANSDGTYRGSQLHTDGVVSHYYSGDYATTVIVEAPDPNGRHYKEIGRIFNFHEIQVPTKNDSPHRPAQRAQTRPNVTAKSRARDATPAMGPPASSDSAATATKSGSGGNDSSAGPSTTSDGQNDSASTGAKDGSTKDASSDAAGNAKGNDHPAATSENAPKDAIDRAKRAVAGQDNPLRPDLNKAKEWVNRAETTAKTVGSWAAGKAQEAKAGAMKAVGAAKDAGSKVAKGDPLPKYEGSNTGMKIVSGVLRADQALGKDIRKEAFDKALGPVVGPAIKVAEGLTNARKNADAIKEANKNLTSKERAMNAIGGLTKFVPFSEVADNVSKARQAFKAGDVGEGVNQTVQGLGHFAKTWSEIVATEGAARGMFKGTGPKSAVPKTEAPKLEAPKTEPPKTEAPKSAGPKSEVPNSESPRSSQTETGPENSPEKRSEKGSAGGPRSGPGERPDVTKKDGGQKGSGDKGPSPPTKPLGEWKTDLAAGNNMKPDQAMYQEQITHEPAAKTYRVNGVDFDGTKPGKAGAPETLLEAKHLGDEGRFAKAYENMKKNNWSDCRHLFDRSENILKQAREQVKAAEGTGAQIEWRVSGEKATQALNLMFEHDPVVAGKITVTHEPLEAKSAEPNVRVRVGQTAHEYLADAKRATPAGQTGQGPRVEVEALADEPPAESPKMKKKAVQP